MKKIILLIVLLLGIGSLPLFSGGDNSITLYLVRHAKSDQSNAGNMPDFDRPLSDRGFADAPAMGKKLKKIGVLPDIIIASPSTRTTQTLSLICDQIKFDFDAVKWDSTIYRCSDEDMLNAITTIRTGTGSAMIVGHNPTITNLANRFQDDTTFEEIPTCGVVALQFETGNWADVRTHKAKLLFFDYPKKP
jgi:phosphohistidine phosphatase